MKRIVVKVGSHVLSEQNRLARERIANLVDFLADLNTRYEVIFVSSGAVAAGYSKLKIDKSILANRQAIAAVGQPYLMSVYQKKFEKYDMLTAQVLLTADDFDSRRRTHHAKQAVNTLLQNGVIPIINENDVTATEELVFGDNDQLSAHVAYYFDADILVILSDIDGYYDCDPRAHTEAKICTRVSEISDAEIEVPHNPNHQFATGGIATKLKAAKFLLDHGRQMYMTSGFDLTDARNFLLEGRQSGGTHFVRDAS